ncbi:MAG: molybdenum cofactor guanylyltransferase [Gammaproteobacteria bacterium]|nr:molybdenum cofactor guanylyltransferase [Gammaproteobacteria bacterium]
MNRGENITGVILAGGRSRRMGGQDKGLLKIAGKPMIAHVIAALRPQAGELLISANSNLAQYRRFGFRVTEDITGDYFGPLAGIASAMQIANTEYVLSVPCDSPRLPEDLADVLSTTMERRQTRGSVAHDGVRMQATYSLLHRDLLPEILAFLKAGHRKTSEWHTRHNSALADFSNRPEFFLNVNTLEDARLADFAMGHF